MQGGSVLKSGVLLKKGRLNRAWKPRLFVLSHASLRYFEGERKKGKIPLGCIDDIRSGSCKTHAFLIKVKTAERDYELSASTEAVRCAPCVRVRGGVIVCCVLGVDGWGRGR